MVMKKASDGDSPLQQGAGKSFWTLPISRRRRRRLSVCFEKVFPSREIYRRKGSVRRWARGHTMAWCGCLLAPLRLCFGLRDASRKIGILAFVSSNSGNISCIAFLKHKNSKNRELPLCHLVNRLVLENT
jgi:hypothetical protein